MKSYSRPKTVLIVLLAAAMLTTGCSSQWISVALADLPVLLQMALNIGNLVSTLDSGQQLSASDATQMQNISAEATRDLNLLQTLYKEYKAAPNAATVQKIQSAIADTDQNLPAVLAAAHISDPALSVQLTAAVNLILGTVNSFAALIPAQQNPQTTRAAVQRAQSIPKPADLKRAWNHQVCGAAGASENAAATCFVK